MDLRRACGCVVLLFAVSVVGPEGRPAPRVLDVRSLVRNVANFTDADWAAVENGAPVAKVLETDAREVAIAGAVRIAAPRERLVARLRDVDHLKRSAVVRDVGRFRRPPAASDLSNVPFEDYSLDLRDCRSGDCRVRLTSADIESFHHAIDWRSSDWRTRAAAVWRDVLARHAATYSELGRKGLPVYVNRADPLNVASELSVLAGSFAFVAQYSPEFYAYLKEFGPSRPAGTEETLYWSKEDFGIRPVLRISHQISVSGDRQRITRPRRHEPGLCRPLPRCRARRDARRGGSRWQCRPFLLHGGGEPRAHAFSERDAEAPGSRFGAEPEPGGHAQDSECGEIRAGGRSLTGHRPRPSRIRKLAWMDRRSAGRRCHRPAGTGNPSRRGLAAGDRRFVRPGPRDGALVPVAIGGRASRDTRRRYDAASGPVW